MKKSELRDKHRIFRNLLSSKEAEAYGEAIFNHFFLFFDKLPNKIKSIAGYYPIHSEVNCLPILEELRVRGYEIALPYMLSEEIDFKVWESEDRLIVNPSLSTKEPTKSAKSIQPDIIIVPLLSFDEQMNRIGYGKGYYDKTLKKHTNSILVGLAYEVQKAEHIPAEHHDMKLDYIITESDIYEDQTSTK